MSDYTPTTDEVKACAESDNPYGELPEGQFDRWYAEEIRKAKAQALEEAANDGEIQDNRPWVEWWLRKRAKQIKDQL
jgi:hypothetical protein